MPCTTWLAAVVRAPVSFQEKETGAVWRSEMSRGRRLLHGRSDETGRLRHGHFGAVGIHHKGVVIVRATGC